MDPEFRMLINGQLVKGSRTIGVINPATEQVFAQSPVASVGQLDEAVEGARVAQKAWSGLSFDDRAAAILVMAETVEKNQDRLARLLTAEQGKPLAAALFEVQQLANAMRQVITYRLAVHVQEDSSVRRVELHRRPIGVVAGIVPWNLPLGLMANKLPFALFAGNSMILKPAPTTPLSSLLLGEILSEVTPKGLINIITDNNDLGPSITSHPGIDKISFTGSTATGKKVMASASGTVKRLTLELGGNDPAIVLDDVNPKAVAQGIFQSSFVNSGQVCVAIKRAYVHERVYDEVVNELAVLADGARVGDGSQQGVQYGPLQNRIQFEKALGYLEIAKKDGVIAAGGIAIDGPGYFVRPTIVRDIKPSSPLVEEEQFSPILPIVRVRSADEAIDHANRSLAGLGASIWSSDLPLAEQMASSVEAGIVWINQHLNMGPDIPLAPTKQSGFGVELGEVGLEHYTQLKVVNIRKVQPA